MLVKRLVAALVAVALVGGALWLRSKRDDTASGDDPTTTTAPGPAQSILCVPELEAACRAAAAEEGLTVTVEPAGDTVDRLAAADNPGPVLWATLASFPELVDDLPRSRRPHPAVQRGHGGAGVLQARARGTDSADGGAGRSLRRRRHVAVPR